MITLQELSPLQAAQAMRDGEFGAAVREAGRNVAVVLTQDWCGQWAALERSLRELASCPPAGAPELTVFLLVYNLHPFFQENVLGNDQIPYVRYYREGRLIGQSNFASGRQFLSFFS